MPEMKPSFTISAPIDKVWTYLSNMQNVGGCVPGCTVNIIDDVTSEWTMAVKAGPIKKTLNMVNKVVAQDDENHHVEFKCTGDLVDVTGVGDMTPQDGGTFVDFSLMMEAKGGAAALINNLMNTKLGEYQQYFVHRVKEALE